MPGAPPPRKPKSRRSGSHPSVPATATEAPAAAHAQTKPPVRTPWTRPAFFIAMGAAAGGAIVAGVFRAESSGARNAPADLSPPSVLPPWGVIERSMVTFEPAHDDVKASYCSTTPPVWHFHGSSRDAIGALFSSAGIAAPVQEALLGNAKCEPPIDGCDVTPPLESVWSLSEESRRRVYDVLSESDDNLQRNPFARRSDNLEMWATRSDLAPATIADFKKLVYTDRNVALFADEAALCSRLDDAERVRLATALVRTRSLIVKVRVLPHADRSALIAYWGRGNRRATVEPVVRASIAEPGGASIPIASLLPPMPRLRFNTYPTSKDAAFNCWWTALNFFSDQPVDALIDQQHALNVLSSDYREIPLDEASFGDVLVLRDAKGKPLHAATHIADDVAFTKNGGSPGRPWALVARDDLLVTYFHTRSVHAYRRRDFAD